MTPIIFKPRPNRDARVLAVVDATVGWLFFALAWVSAGWLGYVLLDPKTSGSMRLTVLGIVALQQTIAITVAARARRGLLANL